MINVLFVCMGNICRSPSGEGVFAKLVDNAGLSDQFNIDSAGTSAYHIGEPADTRMRNHAAKRGLQLTSKSRKFTRSDLEKFDYILAMDYENYRDILGYDRQGTCRDKVYMMNDFSETDKGADVPDPYYKGPSGFELVLDMLEESCRGLLEYIKMKHGF